MNEIHKYINEINQHTENISREKILGDILGPTFGKFLGSFVNVLLYMNRPKEILELGLGSGYVTSIIAEYADIFSASITTVDISKEKIDRAKLALSKYSEYIDYQHIDMKDYIRNSKKTFDLIIQDSDPFSYKETLIDIAKLQIKGGVLLVHDATVVDQIYCPSDLKKVINEFNLYLKQSHLYTTSLIDLEDGLWFCVRN
jgi:predicted O-methyltransferase YrrM